MRPFDDEAREPTRWTWRALYRAEYGRCVATLTRLLGDIGLAEEAVQDAFAVAAEKWETPPPNPGAWIVTTARNRAIDRLRRESTREARHAQALLLHQPDEPTEVGPVRDDQLRLIFTCCHPALVPARADRAHPAPARRARDAGDRPGLPGARGDHRPADRPGQEEDPRRRASPTGCPTAAELPDRLPPVLTVLYLIFNEGYAATSGPLLRTDLCPEAIRLARELAELMPDEPEVLGLLALLLLTEARRPGPGGAERRAGAARRAGPVAVEPGS